MKVLYHLTFLPPKMPECVAELQVVNALCRQFRGELVYQNPNQFSPIHLPRLLFGFHTLYKLHKKTGVSLHHVYNPDAFAFPFLRLLKRPVVYSISGGVGLKRPNISFFNSLAAVVVPDERSLQRLTSWGLKNAVLVRSGIDTNRFSFSALPPGLEIRLMVGSAPWTQAQFRSKGVEALLHAAQIEPRLHLVFLWRGVLAAEMKTRVSNLGLKDRVQIIQELADVNQVLAGVHASVALATKAGILRAYPHSLLDSLAAGKPVLVSRAIPMADYVERTGCGIVVKQVNAESTLEAIKTLMSRYAALQTCAYQVGQRDFSQQAMIDSFHKVYQKC